MAANVSFASKLRKLIAEDPRTAILLIEILGPPPGLAAPVSGSKPADMSSKMGSPPK